MALHLRREGVRIGRRRAGRLTRLLGLRAIWRAPRTSDPHPEHRVWPYLLRVSAIERPNDVWCADITYMPVRRGFVHLVAIMDWASRDVLGEAFRTALAPARLAAGAGGYGARDPCRLRIHAAGWLTSIRGRHDGDCPKTSLA